MAINRRLAPHRRAALVPLDVDLDYRDCLRFSPPEDVQPTRRVPQANEPVQRRDNDRDDVRMFALEIGVERAARFDADVIALDRDVEIGVADLVTESDGLDEQPSL